MQRIQLNTSAMGNDRLAVVRRVDAGVKRIIARAPHVAVYVFDFESNSWVRADIEGPIFLFERSTAPWHSMLVLNRLSQQNMQHFLHGDLELQNQEPYIIFRDPTAENPQPYGMWFKSAEDRANFWKHISINRIP